MSYARSKNERYLVFNAGELQGSKLDSIRRVFDGWWHGWHWVHFRVGEPEPQPQLPVRQRRRRCVELELQLDRQRLQRQLAFRGRATFVHSPPFAGFSFVDACLCQPPSIFPISSKCSDKAINFLLSNALLSHATRRKNFSRSNLIDALCKYGSFCSFKRQLATKSASVVSTNNRSIFAPRV